MKKFLFIAAAAAALLTACQVKEELAQDSKVAVADEGIKFDVYTQRDVNTKGGIARTNDNTNIGERGFGVFAYYTNGEKYDQNAKPNFMYNQKVYQNDADAWVYEPVKYWPNEYGSAAASDDVDYVTFFAYAPYVEFEPTTGEVVVPASVTDPAKIENLQKFNIVSVNKNNATGDPVIKYVVDTDPATSVDLLWGVAANQAPDTYSPIVPGAAGAVYGKPFIDMIKPANPIEDKLSFNLRHSLAKVKFTIDYIKDDFTPDGYESEEIDTSSTRIFVRSFTMDGWALKGALNLNNENANEPKWKDFDGVKELTFNTLEFNDGRKEGKEGSANGAQNNEDNAGRLNPILIENHSDNEALTKKFDGTKNKGVTNVAQPLFEGEEGFFYVIPRNSTEPVNMTIVYDVETIDFNLASLLSDGATHGISIENKISKEAVLGQNVDIQAGKQYFFKIHIGMTSVKVEAEVTEWAAPVNEADVDLPDNQPEGITYWTVAGVPGHFYTDPVNDGVEINGAWDLIDTEKAWENSNMLQGYYVWCDANNYAFTHRYNEDFAGTANAIAENVYIAAGNVDKTAEEWETAGYYRSWKGALWNCAVYNWANNPHGKMPWVAFNLKVAAPSLDATEKVKMYYDNDEVVVIDNAWFATNRSGDVINEKPWAIASVPGEFSNQELAFNELGVSSFDKSKLSVKYFFSADRVVKHEE